MHCMANALLGVGISFYLMPNCYYVHIVLLLTQQLFIGLDKPEVLVVPQVMDD